jgi:hypothetical protein
VAKPNYSFEKRQRELAKKKKKEEKAHRKTSPGGAEQGPETSSDAPSAPLLPPVGGSEPT